MPSLISSHIYQLNSRCMVTRRL